MSQKIWKFYWDCGRMGFLDGLFVANQEAIDAIIGEEVYFGEVLGKHSEIYGTVSKEDFTLVEADDEFVKKFIEVFGIGTISGYNPFDPWEEGKYE